MRTWSESTTMRRAGACVCAKVIACLLLGGWSSAEAQPPAPATRRTVPLAIASADAGRPPIVARPRLEIPRPRASEQTRIFDGVRLEPWVRSRRFGVRMSASF